MDLPIIDVWQIAKWLFLFGLLLYVVFAAVVVRQIQLMTDTLDVGFEAPVKLLGYIHLLSVISVFILALFIL